MPNPFYAAYVAGAAAAGCEPVFLPATRKSGFLPDLDALDDDLLARTVAIYFGSPTNPQGAVADLPLSRTAGRARAPVRIPDLFGRMLFGNLHHRQAAPGMLEVAGADFSNVVVFNSLSKRSNLPGLRVGLAAGDSRFIKKFLDFRNVVAPQVPGPLQEVAASAYEDEAHVEENRRLYKLKFDLADQIIGDRYGYTPTGGRLLPLARRLGLRRQRSRGLKLWREAGVRILPGVYLAHPQARRQQSRRCVYPRRHGARPGHHRAGPASYRGHVAMRAISVLQRNLDMSVLLPDDLGDAVRRRLREVGGLALIAADRGRRRLRLRPGRSEIHRSAMRPAHRCAICWALPGAVTADLMMQLIGLASIALIAPIAAWGWRLLTHGSLVPRAAAARLLDRRIPCSPPGFASCLPRTVGWPLPTGLGGVVGDLVLRAPSAVFGPIDGVLRMATAIVLGCGALATIAIASGLMLRTPASPWRAGKPPAPRRDDGAAPAISIGWLVHGLLSAKAQLARLLSRRSAANPRPASLAPQSSRLEPRMTAMPDWY